MSATLEAPSFRLAAVRSPLDVLHERFGSTCSFPMPNR
jgi:hypothetical protein